MKTAREEFRDSMHNATVALRLSIGHLDYALGCGAPSEKDHLYLAEQHEKMEGAFDKLIKWSLTNEGGDDEQ